MISYLILLISNRLLFVLGFRQPESFQPSTAFADQSHGYKRVRGLSVEEKLVIEPRIKKSRLDKSSRFLTLPRIDSASLMPALQVLEWLEQDNGDGNKVQNE